MNCNEYRSLIDDALDTSLKGILGYQVRLHLEHCSRCRSYYERSKRDHISLFTALNKAYSSIRLSAETCDRIEREIADDVSQREKTFLFRMPRWMKAAAGFTIFASFVGIAGTLLQSTGITLKSSKQIEESDSSYLVADTTEQDDPIPVDGISGKSVFLLETEGQMSANTLSGNAVTMSSGTAEASLMPVTTESERMQISAEIENGGVPIPPSGDAVSSMGTEYFELDARAFTCLPTNWSPLRSKPLGTIISVR